MATQTWAYQTPAEMTDEACNAWFSLIEKRTGIRLSEERKSYLVTTLARRMRETEFNDYHEYYQYLLHGKARHLEWAIFVDRLTVQETSFFRHESSFALVRDYCYEAIGSLADKSSFDVWSVGCSTGEEPYSLAIMVDEQVSLLKKNVYWGVTATDISFSALSTAKKGVYSDRSLDDMDPIIRQRYFQKNKDNAFEVRPAVRSRVCFMQKNILELETVPLSNFNVIFCQNVLIYFRNDLKRDIVHQLIKHLAPGGLLVIGLGECTDVTHPEITRVKYEDTLAFIRKAP